MANSELKPTPQQPVLGAIARFLRGVQSAGTAESWVPLIGGRNIGGFFLGRAPEEIENWSYGNAPLRMNPNTGVPGLKPGRGEPLADALLLGADVAPAVSGASRLATRGMNAVADAAVRGITRNPTATAPAVLQAASQMSPLTSVIKPKGGNWLAGSVEKAVEPLKQPLYPGRMPFGHNEQEIAVALGVTPEEVLANADPSSIAMNRWLDQKLSKYIRNEMATPEDPVRLQVDRFAAKREQLLAQKDAQIAKATADMEAARAARGFTPEMMTASQARIRELQKERAFIEAQTGLHYSPPQTGPIYRSQLEAERSIYGFPTEGLAVSPQAKRWEDLTDTYLGKRSRASDIIQPNYYLRPEDAQRVYAENPWLFKVPPETDVNLVNRGISQNETGFKHMVDELRNALNPQSGLPPELLLDPKSLDKMTVPQAVQLVDKINAWRSVQKAEADLARASNAATVEHKVYDVVPGTNLPNERGLRWVELKKPDYMDPKALEALAGYEKDPRFKVSLGDNLKNRAPKLALEDALKYEGETMAHCVGGYCSDVAEGRSRIFSLRDAEGRPHVTVEVKPGRQLSERDLPDDVRDMLAEQYGDASRGEFEAAVQAYLRQRAVPDEIVQIKGKQNRAPADEYLPFVQDFVRSGQWSDVGDLGNAGLRRTSDAWNENEMKKILEAGHEVPDYLSPQEIKDLGEKVWPGQWGDVGYAAGGLVDLAQRYDDGGLVERLKGFARAARPEFLNPAITKPVGEAAREVAGNLKLAVTDPRAALTNIARNMQSSFEANPTEWAMNWTGGGLGSMPLAGVIKPKGGNWLAGSVEKAVEPLKSQSYPAYMLPEFQQRFRAAGGSENINIDHHDFERIVKDFVANQPINRWLDTKLTKYIKNEMATPEDPVRALAERGVLHFEPRQVWARKHARTSAGYPPQGVAKSQLASDWEALSDNAIDPRPAGVQAMAEPPYGAEDMPWLLKVPPETPVYNTHFLNFDNEALGFQHLVDELKNALDPATTLPRELRLTPQQLEKVTVPQAVERVAKINAWRAEEAARAEKAGMLENLQAAPRLADDSLQLSFVKQPGGKWVDIPETVTDEGAKLCTSIGKAGGWCTKDDWAAKSYGSGDNRLVALLDAEGRPHLQANIRTARRFGRELPKLAVAELKPPGNSFSSDRAKEYMKRDPEYFAKMQAAALKFLNSGDWGRVNDLEYFKIQRIAPDSTLAARLREAGVDYPEFLSKDDYLALLRKGKTKLRPEDKRTLGRDDWVSLDEAARLYFPDDPSYQEGFLRGAGLNATPDRLRFAAGGLVGLQAKYAGGGAVVSRLGRLIDDFRSGGNLLAARRAERIADEAPQAAERISLNTLKESLARGDNSHALSIVSPGQFRQLAAQLPADYFYSTTHKGALYDLPTMPVSEYLDYLARVGRDKGFEDIPFLDYARAADNPDQLRVSGHEGRHRMRALEKLGDEKALVRLIPRANVREELPRRSREEFLRALEQKYGSPLRLHSENANSFVTDVMPFAEGGAVTTTEYDPAAIDALVNQIMESENV